MPSLFAAVPLLCAAILWMPFNATAQERIAPDSELFLQSDLAALVTVVSTDKDGRTSKVLVNDVIRGAESHRNTTITIPRPVLQIKKVAQLAGFSDDPLFADTDFSDKDLSAEGNVLIVFLKKEASGWANQNLTYWIVKVDDGKTYFRWDRPYVYLEGIPVKNYITVWKRILALNPAERADFGNIRKILRAELPGVDSDLVLQE